MADDAAAVLDTLGWQSAHLVGMSLGGMVAQTLVTRQPARVRTLTSIFSAPAPRIGQPRPTTLLKVVRQANPARVTNRDEYAQYAVDLHRITGSPGYPADEATLRDNARRAYDRARSDASAVQRQTAAIAASGDRRAHLAQISAPTLVLHGDADRIIRPPAGRATATAIPGARLVTYPGMGHELPKALWPTMADQIAALAGRTGTGVDEARPVSGG